MRIVIVEDELKIRAGMAKLISAHTGHEVVGEAKNGKEGLELVLRLRPDLVISDIRMPVMDGLEMLEEIERAGVRCHSVILSGYSEFEYAQKAIRYGVDAYLLKPLAAEDVMELLDKIQGQLGEEEKRQEKTTEGLLRSLFSGDHAPSESELRTLKEACGFVDGQPYFLLAGYLGDTDVSYGERMREEWEKPGEWKSFAIRMENSRQMFCLIQSALPKRELEEKLWRRLYWNLQESDRPVWAAVCLDSPEELANARKKALKRQLYGLRLGYRTLLTGEAVRGLEEEEYEYPKHLEAGFRCAVCNGTAEELENAGRQFMQAVRAMNCAPRYYRHAYAAMLHFVGSVFRELNPGAYKAIQNLDIDRQIADAVTIKELEYCLEQVLQVIRETRDSKDDIRNYTILRAINYIKEHYQENISLEQISGYLEMTPEYLSTLFNREVGINFSAFLKRFRISHAKRLLKGTDKKIYEIAQEVGYHDPKYFARVFKEEVGVSPGDFRL